MFGPLTADPWFLHGRVRI